MALGVIVHRLHFSANHVLEVGPEVSDDWSFFRLIHDVVIISDSGLLLLSHGAPWISICDMTGLMLQHIPVCGDWIISVLHAVRLSTPFLVRYHVSYHPIVSFMGSYSPRGPIKEPMMLHHFFFLDMERAVHLLFSCSSLFCSWP